MSEPIAIPKVWIDATIDGEKVVLSKPEIEAGNAAYRVEAGEAGTVVWLERGRLSFPLTILFSATGGAAVISAVGFAQVLDPADLPIPPQCTKAGPCGACFRLEADAGQPTATVLDGGDDAEYGFTFALWLTNTVTGRTLRLDPRIYNRGQLERPWWRRLWRAVQGLGGRR
jgi:hypothetical protein